MVPNLFALDQVLRCVLGQWKLNTTELFIPEVFHVFSRKYDKVSDVT